MPRLAKRAWLILIIALVVGTLGVTPRVQGADSAIAPQVIDTNPARGEELPLSGAVAFYFDEAMDHGRVEAAFSTKPSIKGAFSWTGDTTALFTPQSPLQRATEYIFSFSTGAKSGDGVALKDAYSVKLRTAGNLEVAQVFPANGAKDVEAAPTITVLFTRPVVPLGTAEDMAKLPSPITITPAADGKGTWISTSIYSFTPTQLQSSVFYTVTVNKGLTDVTGSVLTNDVKFGFTTVAPRVIQISPDNNQDSVLRDDVIRITFSQPMNTQATEKALSLRAASGTAAAPGDVKWNIAQTELTLTPKALLDYGQTYQIKVDAQIARSSTGGILQADAVSNFKSVSKPDIINTNPPNNQSDSTPGGGFQVNFTSPMKLDNFKDHVTVDPKPGLVYDDEIDDNGFFYHINFSTEPGTSYTITIDPNGLVDKYGTPLVPDPKSAIYTVTAAGKIQFKYTTANYAPEASLQTGSFVGLYSAYNPQTRVYSTHRNVSSLELSLSTLALPDFINLTRSNNNDFASTFKPASFLRRWQVAVANPTNVLRYDLLTISAQGANLGQSNNVACPGTPPTQIKVGDTVVVLADDPTPQRVRDNAGLTGNVVAQAKPGVTFSVVGGPLCADKYIWWQVVSADGTIKGWTAEGDVTHYFIGPKAGAPSGKAAITPTAVATADNSGAALKPGLYWLTFESPELPDASLNIDHIMVVATANVTLKVSQRELVAWVTDLKSGKPVPNASVLFLTVTGATPPAKITTDANGLARYPLPQSLASTNQDVYAVVDDGTNFGVGANNWNDGIQTYAFNQDQNYNPQDLNVYMYTDRALYRPSQPVYFRGVVRTQNDVTYQMSSLKTVPVEVFDDQGKSVYQKDEPLTPFGTFADSFTLDASSSLGFYRIVATPDTAQKQFDGNPIEFTEGFNVAEYRLPEFKVTTTADQSQVVQGDKIKVAVDSSYFFGGAVSNADVMYTVTSDPYYFNYQGSGSYNFVDYNEDSGPSAVGNFGGNTVAQGEGKTDSLGKFTIEVPADLGKNPQSQTFTIEAQITDASDQVVAGRTDVVVNQGQFYLGVTPEQYVGAANQSQKVDLVSVGWDSKPQPGTDISVKVVERTWHSVQTVEPGTGRTVWEDDVKETPLTDGVVHTDQDGKAVFEFTPPHGGDYKIYATSRDSKGNQVTSSAFAWIAGPDYVPWRQQNSNRIDLKIDKTNYKIGETAEVLIASPFQGEATALVTVERGELLKTDLITMTTNSTIYKLPITPDMAPNAYVSVMVVKGIDAKNPVAAFRMGLVELGVETDHLKLNIQLTPDKPQAGPRDKVNYKIHVTDYQGKPVQAEVGLALVDEAALSLLPDQSTPILDYFYGKQGLSVQTASTLTLSVDQETQQIINTIKGGGGGGPETGIFTVRQDFVTTPLWAPSVLTDANGDATAAVTLPDNLTTWQLDARAVSLPTGESQTTLVGQTTGELLSTKPLLIRPVTPRFYVVGDTSTFAAIVNNNTDQAQDVNVKIEVTGATLKADAALKGNIPAKGQARFEWPVEVQDVSAVGVTFFANTTDNKYTDAAKSAVGQGNDLTLPVLRYEAPETVGTGGIITNEGGSHTEGILLPQSYKVTQGTLDLKLDPSLAASMTSALGVLKTNPDQSLEQTVSGFLPNLMTYRALKQLALDTPQMKTDLGTAINYALQRLYSEQHVDGGWGWFVRDDSDPLMTAYALIGLSEANQQGFAVDKDVMQKAITFIQKNVKDVPDQAQTWELNRQVFLQYALARAGAGNVSRAVRLFDLREKMSVYARAYLALTFHLLTPADTRYTDPLISDLQTRAITTATGQHWEEDYDDYYNWNTNTRTTSIVLEALVQIQPKNPLLPNVVRWLMVTRTSDGWETSQETAWAVMSLTDWMQVSGELKPNYTFGVTVNDKPLATDQNANSDTVRNTLTLQVAVQNLLADQVNKIVINRSSGDGILYYTAHLTAYLPADQVKSLTRGLSITRTYSLEGDKDKKPITQAKVGDVIQVTLNIIAPNDLNYVVINDPIPAGTEAIDPQLSTSAVGKAPELSQNDPLSTGWGWWWFSKTELRDDRTVLYATFLPKGSYQFTYSLQAGLAGTYHVIPATGQETYFPEVYGRSDGMLFTLVPGDNSATTP